MIIKGDGFMACISDRNYDKKLKWKPHLLEDGCSLPSKIPSSMAMKVKTLIEKLINELKLKNCVLKLDLACRDNVVYVIEVAPRLGGGKLSSTMIPLYCEMDWWKVAIQLCLNLPIKESATTKLTPVVQRYVMGKNPKSHHDRGPDFICTGKTIEEAIQKAEQKVAEYEG